LTYLQYLKINFSKKITIKPHTYLTFGGKRAFFAGTCRIGTPVLRTYPWDCRNIKTPSCTRGTEFPFPEFNYWNGGPEIQELQQKYTT
jgi:hypothetical protein